MLKALFGLRKIMLPAAISLSLAGCGAGGRDVAKINAPVAPAADNTTALSTMPASTVPVTGHAFIKLTVKDARHFEASPRDPSEPSLENSADIANPAITARAIARKRNHYGMANGDVVLPDNTSVADMVRAAAQNALQDKGYTVVDSTAPQYASAQTLAIEIDELWEWYTPGVFAGEEAFKARLTLTGDSVGGANRIPVSSDTTAPMHVSPDGPAFTRLFQTGMTALDGQIAAKIKTAP